ncbi:MAG: hypothetical protein WA820_27380 [Bradyrhizobium sp.]|jgi:hypothetical protein
MSKIALLGGAALLASVLATPALAQHRVAHPGQYYARGLAYCTHEAGNPYAPEEDYMAWSGWRARGGWDDRPDPNCPRRWYPQGPAFQ